MKGPNRFVIKSGLKSQNDFYTTLLLLHAHCKFGILAFSHPDSLRTSTEKLFEVMICLIL